MKVFRLDVMTVNAYLQTFVRYRTNIPDSHCPSRSRIQRHRRNQIGGFLVIIIQRHIQSMIQYRKVKSQIIRTGFLPRKLVIGRSRDVITAFFKPGTARRTQDVVLSTHARVGRVTGKTVSGTQCQAVKPIITVHKTLFRNFPCQTDRPDRLVLGIGITAEKV